MGITDPAEFQRVARDYCKDMAMEMTLPAYMRWVGYVGLYGIR